MTQNLSFLRDIFSNLNQDISRQGFRAIGNSTSYIKPGEVLTFDYNMQGKRELPLVSRVALVVQTDRTPTGYYVSSQNNLLLTMMNLNTSSPAVRTILGMIYKNRDASYYQKLMGSFEVLLGKGNFRTYMLKKIRSPKLLLLQSDRF